MRESVLTYNEAMAMINDYMAEHSNNENLVIEERSADCSSFPCPDGLDSWSGETNAIYVWDSEENEDVFAVAYWQASGVGLADLKLIFSKLGVERKEDLVAWVCNSGRNPQFGIYAKDNIYRKDCNRREFEATGRHPWIILDETKRIEATEDTAQWDLAEFNASFYDMMEFAELLDDAAEFAEDRPII